MVIASQPYATTPSFRKVATNLERSLAPSLFWVRFVLAATGVFAIAGALFGLWLRRIPAGNPDPRLTFNAFHYLFARNEPLGLAVVAVFNIAFAAFLPRFRSLSLRLASTVARPQIVCLVVAALTVAVTALGSSFVFHDYLLTADENMADFQAQIFMHGQFRAQVPLGLVNAAHVIRPTFTGFIPATHEWNAQYLPVYAAIRALFQLGGLQFLVNPIMAAILLFALYAVARNIWPDSGESALAAIALLASSAQFLLMSMTGYSMPAHLAFNTVWLWLYSRPDRPRFYLAPLVGALAIGLHQPNVHALFVLPFLIRMVWQRRWFHVAVFGVVYLVACVGWYWWKRHFEQPAWLSAGTHSPPMFKLLNWRMLFVQPMDLLLVIGWGSLAFAPLLLLGIGAWRKAPIIIRDCMLSCALTFGFYYFFFLDQAHGWGYRYFHSALSCAVLVAVFGFQQLRAKIGAQGARAFLGVAIAASVFVQLPLRCFQAESFVRPYARAAAVIHHFPADVVALDARQAWYSADLIRNDPFLSNRPLVVSIVGLNPPAIEAVSKLGSVHFFTAEELTKLGLFTARRDDYQHDPFMLGSGR